MTVLFVIKDSKMTFLSFLSHRIVMLLWYSVIAKQERNDYHGNFKNRKSL